MKKTALIGMLVLLLVMLAACGNGSGEKEATGTNTTEQTPATSEPAAEDTNTEGTDSGTRTITYLDQEYTVPANVEKIVITGAMEAMEDALVLDVHPAGAISVGGEFPERFTAITDQAQSIGEKIEPNFETILSLKPDVILGTTKFKPEVVEQLKKIAPLIQVSHIASDWEANLNLMAELTGKQDMAKQIIEDYQAEAEAAKAKLGDTLKDKEVTAIRIRGGEMYIYPANVFVNPVLYEDLGLTPPAEVNAAKAQELVSVEQFAEINPDYVFIQFEELENADKPAALDDIKNNPIIQKTTAFKDGHVFINVVDPLSEGGPAWSRTNFLKAAVEQLSK
ncbi:ABC transporter substrate-binding protein [Paenibacillus sp. Marseille-Q4541]|uniref:ABC transporter substrate-binding protein n=1 Tax=Paenibacillus sp. Marseille-Q4541 TaxID=2831522 RepID=UPI001BAE0A07|nr:ABC transporter substrate-binding protein [Paenibacillus sp. Marseille-Q4541]